MLQGRGGSGWSHFKYLKDLAHIFTRGAGASRYSTLCCAGASDAKPQRWHGCSLLLSNEQGGKLLNPSAKRHPLIAVTECGGGRPLHAGSSCPVCQHASGVQILLCTNTMRQERRACSLCPPQGPAPPPLRRSKAALGLPDLEGIPVVLDMNEAHWCGAALMHQ